MAPISTAAAMGIAAGASAIAGTGTNVAFQSKLNKKNRTWQDQVRMQQRQWSLEDWQREVDYNSPTAIMARYDKAGINKTFALTNGASVQAPSTKSADTPGADTKAPQMDLQSILNATSLGAQIENTRADTAQKSANVTLLDLEATTEELEQAGIRLDNALKSGNYKLFQDTYEYQRLLSEQQTQLLKAQIDESLKRAGVSEEHIKSMRQDREYQEKRYKLDALDLWNKFQNTGIAQQNANTNRFNAETSRNRLTLESPWFGQEKRPWWMKAAEDVIDKEPGSGTSGFFDAFRRWQDGWKMPDGRTFKQFMEDERKRHGR